VRHLVVEAVVATSLILVSHVQAYLQTAADIALEYRRGGSSSQRPASFDEYEGADDFDEQPRRSNSAASRPPMPVAKTAEPPQPKAKQPEVDLFSFGDDEPVAAPAAQASAPLASLDGQSSFLLGDCADGYRRL
jgi:hypothetical protein